MGAPMNDSIRWPLVENHIRKSSESNTFGRVRKHADGSPKPHQGWDFYAALGTNCYAIGAGKVVYSHYHGDFGLLVVTSFKFRHQELFAVYAHLKQVFVELNQAVEMGTPIGETGNSGNAANLTGDELHLHFEVRNVPMPGLGLAGRISPFHVYGICPLHQTISCPVQPSLIALPLVEAGAH